MEDEQKKCEVCGKQHDGSYGSGRFCGRKCARSFSTRSKRADINKRVSQKLRGRDVRLERLEKQFSVNFKLLED